MLNLKVNESSIRHGVTRSDTDFPTFLKINLLNKYISKVAHLAAAEKGMNARDGHLRIEISAAELRSNPFMRYEHE
jgi:hypothetical protein